MRQGLYIEVLPNVLVDVEVFEGMTIEVRYPRTPKLTKDEVSLLEEIKEARQRLSFCRKLARSLAG